MPLVRVSDLKPDSNGALPHYYHDKQALCLYDAVDWRPWMKLADTIVPWTVEWLWFYELWKATGEWHGSGGNHIIAPRATKASSGSLRS